MHTAIITTETVGPVKNGGIGTYTFNLARLLRRYTDDRVTIIYVGPIDIPSREWRHLYEREQIDLILVNERQSSLHYPAGFGQEWYLQRAEAAFAKLPADVDVVYLQDNGAAGFHLVRHRRFLARPYPVTVTMMHGSRDWVLEAMEIVPESGFFDLSISFMEQYGIHRSDFVLSNSQYLLDWVISRGWKLPSMDKVRVMGLPFLPESEFLTHVSQPAPQFRRLIFFGRLETRKGFELFVETLLYMLRPLADSAEAANPLDGIDEVVFLGREDVNRYGSARAAAKLLEAQGLKVVIMDKLSTLLAQRYLLDHAPDSLVVIPSLTETLGYTVIETSLLPGINAIYSNAGGIPEVLGELGTDQLFEPNIIPFAHQLAKWIKQSPRADRQLAKWDYTEINDRWLTFHKEACALAQERKNSSPLTVTSQAAGNLLVDICICFTHQSDSLPQVLQAVSTQTLTGRYSVTIIDDGSILPTEIMCFQQMEAQYRSRDWRFVRFAQRQGSNAARNHAASLGTAPYLLFIDANCLLAPNAVERLVNAALSSGDDCLTCYTGELAPQTTLTDWTQDSKAVRSIHIPLGNSTVAGMLVNVFGQHGLLVSRAVFDAIGGFSLRYQSFVGLPNDEYEFLVSLSLKAYRLDVIPELLIISTGDHLTQGNPYQEEMRVQSLYADQLMKLNMGSLIPLVLTSHIMLKHLAGTQQGLGTRTTTDEYFFQQGQRLIPIFENVQATGLSASGELSRNLHNPQWIAHRIPWRKLVGALINKLRKYRTAASNRKVN